MKQTIKRVISIVLAIVLMLQVQIINQPNEVNADGYGLRNPRITKKGADILTEWDCIYFGRYPQARNSSGKYVNQSIKWRVLSVNGKDAFLVADKALDCVDYHNICTDVTWETCDMRKWLRETFLKKAFNSNEQAAIMTTEVINEDNPYENVDGGNNTFDKVYVLSLSEASNEKYGFLSEAHANSKTRECKVTDYAESRGLYPSYESKYKGNCWWWLRTPGNSHINAVGVGHQGLCYRYGGVGDGGDGMRPVLHLDLSRKVWTKAGTINSDGKVKGIANNANKPWIHYVKGTYRDGGVDKKIDDIELYSDNYFLKGNSSKNNWKLASLSMLASAAAYNKTHAEDLIDKCKFENHKYYPAKSDLWNHNRVSFEVAYKKVNNTYIVAVWIKGSSDMFKHPEDWVSNVQLGNLAERIILRAHAGFVASEINMFNKINSYLKNKVKLDKSGKVKIWVTGHSRGGAVANLFAKRMNGKIGKSNVFAYTFASPKVKVGIILNKKNYSNIFNYVNKNDLVPKMPPGYRRYGVNKIFKIKKKNNKKMKKIFKKLTGKKFYYKSLKNSKTLKKKFKAIKHAHCQTAYLAWLKARIK